MFGNWYLFSFGVGSSVFDVRRSSFETSLHGINVTCQCSQNNLAIMGPNRQGAPP